MFRRLQTKLTVLYAGLFGATLLLIWAATCAAVSRNVEHMVRGELAANGAVFDRIWSLRSGRLQEEADVLAHDFGFRAAVATGDVATTRSALENLRSRLGIDAAFMVGLDGRVVSVGAGSVGLPPSVAGVIQDNPHAAGAFAIGDTPYYGAAAPVLAPSLAGTVVFATRLDRADLGAMDRLSAIPLHTSVMTRRADGGWAAAADFRLPFDPGAASAFTRRALSDPSAPPAMLTSREGPAAAVVKRLAVIGGGQQVVLLISYPLNKALAPFSVMLATIALIGAGGLVLLVAGSWGLAATLTRPLSALEAAVKRLQRGERAQVEVSTGDEIGSLGASFNAMAGDIRDREERLERAKALAEAANRSKSSFLANMSHEVRTPLNGVLGVAGVLAGTTLDQRQRQMVTIIESSASTLQRVLSDVLDIARMEAGRFDFIEEAFDLGEVVRRLGASTDIQAGAKGVGFELSLPPEADGWVLGDRVRLEQILSNLLGNALKFTAGGQITLAVERAQDACRFVVRDTGIGFDPADAEQLFQPFLQADQSITRRYGGTGLGLAIARDLARGMQGELTGEGAAGRGAAFTLVLALPACAPAAGVASLPHAVTRMAPPRPAPPVVARLEREAPDPQPQDGDVLRILLADDHATNRTVVQLILDSVGVDLVAVENGAEAVDAFMAQDFHAVIMDIQMPVMDGLTAVRLIREFEQRSARKPTPIVVLSANVMPEHLESSAAAGADEHVGKPVLAPVLLEALDNVLARAEAAWAEPVASAG